MNFNNKYLVSLGLIAISVIGLLLGNTEISAAAVGGLVGWLAGERQNDQDEED